MLLDELLLHHIFPCLEYTYEIISVVRCVSKHWKNMIDFQFKPTKLQFAIYKDIYKTVKEEFLLKFLQCRSSLNPQVFTSVKILDLLLVNIQSVSSILAHFSPSIETLLIPCPIDKLVSILKWQSSSNSLDSLQNLKHVFYFADKNSKFKTSFESKFGTQVEIFNLCSKNLFEKPFSEDTFVEFKNFCALHNLDMDYLLHVPLIEITYSKYGKRNLLTEFAIGLQPQLIVKCLEQLKVNTTKIVIWNNNIMRLYLQFPNNGVQALVDLNVPVFIQPEHYDFDPKLKERVEKLIPNHNEQLLQSLAKSIDSINAVSSKISVNDFCLFHRFLEQQPLNDFDMISKLNIDLSRKDSKGCIPLHCACKFDHMHKSAFKELVKMTCKIDENLIFAQDYEGNTILHHVAKHSLNFVKARLQQLTDILPMRNIKWLLHTVNNKGETPFATFVFRSSCSYIEDMIKELDKYGFDASVAQDWIPVMQSLYSLEKHLYFETVRMAFETLVSKNRKYILENDHAMKRYVLHLCSKEIWDLSAKLLGKYTLLRVLNSVKIHEFVQNLCKSVEVSYILARIAEDDTLLVQKIVDFGSNNSTKASKFVMPKTYIC